MRLRIGRLDDLPDGRGTVVEAGGRELAIFRAGDRVFALDNVCPHRGAALAFGDVRDGVVFCPLHAWPFALSDGSCPERPGACVEVFPVHVEGGEVHVEL